MRLHKSTYDGSDETLLVKPMGDWHLGHTNCRIDIIQAHLSQLSHNTRGLLMGDLAECATKESIGKGLFDTTCTPKKQRDTIIQLLEPYKDYIDGVVCGNHEFRIEKDTSLDITEDICKALGLPYLGFQGFVKYAWNKRAYVFNIWHGAGRGSTTQAAIDMCEKMAHRQFADVYCIGHFHKLVKSDKIFRFVDLRNNKLINAQQEFIVCGSALDYEDGYAEQAGLTSRKLGFPMIELSGKKDEKRIEVRL